MSKPKKSKNSKKHGAQEKYKIQQYQAEDEMHKEVTNIEKEHVEKKQTKKESTNASADAKGYGETEKVSSKTKEKKVEKENSVDIDDVSVTKSYSDTGKVSSKTKEKKVEKEDSVDTGNELKFDCAECKKLRKTNKTLIAVIILLAGVAIGSFFVDIAQLFTQRGFSARAIEDAQVVEYNGNTWVRYDDPKIVVDVFDAADCEDCVTDEVLVRLRSLIPTLEAHRIDVRTDEGREYAQENDIKHIPAFLFSDKIIESDFYQGAAILFKEAPDNKYYFEATNVGVPVGEYLETPAIDNGIVSGSDDAQVTVVLYTDFVCDMCKTVDPIINKVQKDFKDNIQVVVKVTPDEEKNAMKLAMATQCAHAQDAFDKYSAILFTNQKTLKESDDVNILLTKYATNLQLDAEVFTKCLDSKEQKENIQNNITEASRFGITGTPTLFINGQPHVGVITYENLKTQIESIINPVEENVEQ